MQRWIVLGWLVACGHEDRNAAEPIYPKFDVTSSAFASGTEIPSEHTCEGPADHPPPLAWSGAPAATQSFALIVDDPDAPDPAAPKRTWVHWVVAAMPAIATSVPADATIGSNDWNKPAWGGPCPPIGRHRYFFKVYALDAAVGRAGMTKAELEAAMKGHVLAMGELVGTYQKHAAAK